MKSNRDGAIHEWFHKILPKLDPHVTVMDNTSYKTEKTKVAYIPEQEEDFILVQIKRYATGQQTAAWAVSKHICI